MTFTLNVRTALRTDASAITRVHIDTWKTAYQGLIPQKLLDGLDFDKRAKNWDSILSTDAVRQRHFVAELDGKIIGFSCGWKCRDAESEYDGELYAVYVLAEHQKTGIGKQLTIALAKRLELEGFKSMKVWVLEKNERARKFYEKMGATLLEEFKREEFGDALIEEVAYAWTDITKVGAA